MCICSRQSAPLSPVKAAEQPLSPTSALMAEVAAAAPTRPKPVAPAPAPTVAAPEAAAARPTSAKPAPRKPTSGVLAKKHPAKGKHGLGVKKMATKASWTMATPGHLSWTSPHLALLMFCSPHCVHFPVHNNLHWMTTYDAGTLVLRQVSSGNIAISYHTRLADIQDPQFRTCLNWIF